MITSCCYQIPALHWPQSQFTFALLAASHARGRGPGRMLPNTDLLHSSLYSSQQRTGMRRDICSLNCILYAANQKSLSLDSDYLERNDIMSREPTIGTLEASRGPRGGFTEKLMLPWAHPTVFHWNRRHGANEEESVSNCARSQGFQRWPWKHLEEKRKERKENPSVWGAHVSGQPGLELAFGGSLWARKWSFSWRSERRGGSRVSWAETAAANQTRRAPFSVLKTSVNIYQGGCLYLS